MTHRQTNEQFIQYDSLQIYICNFMFVEPLNKCAAQIELFIVFGLIYSNFDHIAIVLLFVCFRLLRLLLAAFKLYLLFQLFLLLFYFNIYLDQASVGARRSFRMNFVFKQKLFSVQYGHTVIQQTLSSLIFCLSFHSSPPFHFVLSVFLSLFLWY